MKNRTPVICDRCRASGYLGEGEFAALAPILDFKPVPRKTKRKDGWTPERQRGFIEALAKTGSVSRAAMAVNMAKEGAYQLRFHPEAGEFIEAWNHAAEFGTNVLDDAVIDRAINGVAVPIFHAGEQVGERRVYNERLAMWQLQHRKPEKYGPPPGKGTRNHRTESREDWESRKQARIRAIELLLLHYQNRVQMERHERDRGNIDAADFYLRQLSYFEIVLECGGAALDLIDIALGKRHHKRPWDWQDAGPLATTPLSWGLAEARQKGWDREAEGKDVVNQAGHPEELAELAEAFDDAFEEGED